ncbi:MAG: hypothetical protein IPM29_32545 [Planctomycetes bacterium]|nr:hypothetical protein [Planctomycetota bacterium]
MELRDVVLLSAGFVFSVVAALVGAWVQRKFDRYREMGPLNRLLNFGADQLLFVFPHRDETPEAILPRTSTEDFLAMNNFISALLRIAWSRKVGVRDTKRVTDSDRRRNLVIICSPKSNKLSEDFQTELRRRHPSALYFEEDRRKHEWCICDGDGARYRSPSWAQERQYLSSGVPRTDLPSQKFEDYAVITKTENPWNTSAMVIQVAGIRGIGTWGAAECIKKEWRQLYDHLPTDAKDGEFSALVRIEYDNCDITAIDVRRVILLGG